MKSIIEKETYKIKITDSAIVPTEPNKYNAHANNGKCFKIYIVKNGNRFLYVGMAKQSIRSRFAGSFRAFLKKQENGVSEYSGYSGYKWIDEFQKSKEELDLIVVPFNDKISENDKSFIEAIEAEIVYLIRNKTNQWPIKQHEIHFHNIQGTKEIAEEIFMNI